MLMDAFILTPTERWAILAGSFGLLGVVTFVTVCIVCPFCWVFKRIQKSRSQEKLFGSKGNQVSEKTRYGGCLGAFNQYLDSEPPPPYEPRADTEMRHLSDYLRNNRKLTPTNSASSASESVTGIPLPLIDDAELELPDPNASVEGDQGYFNIGFLYKPPNEKNEEFLGQLTVMLKDAIDLPFRQYGGRCNPYLEIQLYKVKGRQKTIKPESVPVCQFYTSIIRKTQNPVFNEAYVIPLAPEDLQKYLIKLIAWDKDKLANDSIIGNCILSLKDLSLQDGREHQQTLTFKETIQSNGQLLLGLCYLPTAERMTVAVLKANNLRQIDGCQHTAPYVQAIAIYGGRVLEKRKTSSRPNSSFPVFNEMLMFDVPHNKLDHIVLLVVVRSNADSRSQDIMKPSPGNDPYIGKVVIGSCCKKNGSHHWTVMKNSPRRQVIQWHVLQ